MSFKKTQVVRSSRKATKTTQDGGPSWDSRWSLIAGHLPGRTDNEIKNHWNSHLSRRARDDGVVVDVDLSKLPGGGKRRGGRASRDAVAAATKAAKGKPKGKKKATGKPKNKPAAAAAAETEHHHHHRKEEDNDDSKESTNDDISTSSTAASQQGEEQAHASSSGVTSDDGLEEGALGLCEEMLSGLKGQSSRNLDVTPINVVDSEPPTPAVDHDDLLGGSMVIMELDHHHDCSNDNESGPAGQEEELGDKAAMELGHPGCCNDDASGPSEDLAQTVLGDKAVMEWDLVGLDDHLANDDLWSSMVWDYDEVVAPGVVGQEEESVLANLFFLDNI